MKLTAFFLFIICLQVSARSFSQTVTLSEKHASLESVLRSMEQQTGYSFWYRYSLLKEAVSVDVELKNVLIADALAVVFKDQPLVYEIIGKTVVIKKRVVVETKNEDAGIDIHGRVTDSLGNPLAGASVTVKGKGKGVETDVHGLFELKGIGDNATIVVSFTGFESREYRVSGQSALSIVLKRSTSPLDAVQIIAYGTTTRRFNVGSVATVSGEEIDMQPVSNPLEALEGRVPGLVVTQSSGVPGAAVTVQIRGQNTLNLNAQNLGPRDQPLFIIDGVPFAPQNANLNQYSSIASTTNYSYFNNAYGGMSAFNVINASDIESVEVLKDADATAIYGSRGSNGVILITTKKGKAGKTAIAVSASSGESIVTKTMPMMNTRQYLDMRYEAIKNDGFDSLTDVNVYAPDLLILDTTHSTDWRKVFLGGTAHYTTANASISGGNANTQFLFGAGYNHQSYIFPGNLGENKLSGNLHVNHNSSDKKLSIDIAVNYGYVQNRSIGDPNALLAFVLPPNYPSLINPDGSLNWDYKGLDLGSAYNGFENPYASLKQKYILQSYNLGSHLLIGYQLLPGLTLRSGLGYTTFSSQENFQRPIAAQNPANDPVASSYFGAKKYTLWNIEPQLEYKRNIGGGKFDLLLGETFEQRQSSSSDVEGEGYTNDALMGTITAAASVYNSDSYTLYKYAGVFGRINYIWSDKYIFNVSGRRDGSSRFGSGNQFGNFGAVGAGWIFSEEPAIKRVLNFMSFGKLYASYGTSGGDNVGDYQYSSNWKTTLTNGSGSTFLGTVGYYPVNLANPDFHWQVNKKLEAGIDLAFFGGRLSVNPVWFRNRCSNQLVSYNVPIQTGFNSVTQNFPASVQNTGWEILISSTNISQKNFKWSTLFNLSIERNKLLSFPGLASTSYAYNYVVGKSISRIQAVKYAGVNDTTGLFQFVDAKGALTYSPISTPAAYGGDMRDIGNYDPQYSGGVGNSFTYKGIQLDVFLEFRKQIGANYLNSIYAYANAVGIGMNEPVAALNRWRKPGDHAELQKYTTSANPDVTNAAYLFTVSDGAYSDASYIRVKTVALSYSLNRDLLKKIGVQGIRIYANAQNLFTLTHYKGTDPETKNFYGVPPLRTVVAGIQVNL